VVWEDGGGDTASYPIALWIVAASALDAYKLVNLRLQSNSLEKATSKQSSVSLVPSGSILFVNPRRQPNR
jgi:hypothetical protein